MQLGTEEEEERNNEMEILAYGKNNTNGDDMPGCLFFVIG